MTVHKFIKTIPLKLYLFLLAIVLLSFFSNDFGLVDIQKTAVILAAGIDKAEDGFSLTAQIAVPKGSDRTQGGTSSVEVNAEGKTVSDCVTEIFAKTGWVPKVVFCNLILLGEEAAKEDTISELNYFLRNEYMNDSCFLAVCEGKAEELLSSTSATDDTSSFAIVKLFSDAAEKSGKVMPNTLKEFAVGYYSVSGSSFMPYLRAETQKKSPKGGEQSGGGEEGGQQGGDEEKIYRAEETAIFSEGKMVAILPSEQTLAFSLLKGNVKTGTFGAYDKEEPITLTVLKNEGKVKLNMKNAPKVEFTLNVMVRLCCRGTTAPIEDVSSDDVKPEVLSSAKETLEEYSRALWKTIVDADCDLFNLKRELYRSSAKKYEKWKDYFPNSLTPSFETRVESQK